VVRFEGNVVLNLDNLSPPEEAAAPPDPPASSGKAQSVSGKSANSK
jgi:hypothetical protein